MGVTTTVTAQDYTEYYHGYTYLANSDARIVTTLHEVGDDVHVEALAIGYLYMGAITVSLCYDADVVVPIMGPGGAVITLNLTTTTAMGDYLWVNPALPNASLWRKIAIGKIQAAASIKTTFISIGATNSSSNGLILGDGEILQVFKLFFKKLPGKTLTESTFTYYNRTLPPIQQNEFSKVAAIHHTGADMPPMVNLYPQMFTRRCPATIETGVPSVYGTKVILNGLANAEKIAKQSDLLQLLDWDNILSTGFIYSKNDVTLTMDEYSQKLSVNGEEYDFPGIADGVFTLGDYSFTIATTENSNNHTRIEMQEVIRDLEVDIPYYAYAFMTYKFQTSHAYPLLGNQISFTPTLCNEQPLVLNESEFSVCNTVASIDLTYNNYTESGSYKLMYDAAGIEAGFVNMNDYVTVPESTIEIAIPYGVNAGVYPATLLLREVE
jgi:hypothetical protein